MATEEKVGPPVLPPQILLYQMATAHYLSHALHLAATLHFGTAVAGPFGSAGNKRHDVIGKVVNTAALLDSSGVTLSVAAFRKLSPPLRRRFKKHTPPVTYIRTEDPRRFR